MQRRPVTKVPAFSDDPETRRRQFEILHEESMQYGIERGWWEVYDHKGPINVRRVHKCDFRSLAHLLCVSGFFPSIGAARKAGFDRPLEVGEFKLFGGREKFIVCE